MPDTSDLSHRKRLTKDDWIAAGLNALRVGGLKAVAIEPLAATLGATKGSGYWHFRDRAALLRATLEAWEREHTEQVITMVEAEDTPEARLRALFTSVMRFAGEDSVELTLASAADDPEIGPVLERVTRRRLDYLSELFEGLGFDPAEANRRALFSYATYLGHGQLGRSAGRLWPRDRADLNAYVDDLIRVMTVT